MARPLKTGIDYFPLDVVNDDKIELLEAKFGLEGYGILVKLWQKIYSNGYFIEWNDDISLLFSRRINANINLVNDVVNECLLRNLFDNGMSKLHNILTSNGIQERYFKICSDCRRKNIKLINEYLLVDIKDYKFTPALTELTPTLTSIKTVESTQIKEEEIKEDKKKETRHKYGEYKNVLLTDTQYKKLIEDYGEKQLLDLIKQVDEGVQMKGYKYKDFNLVIRKWAKNANINSKESEEQYKDESRYERNKRLNPHQYDEDGDYIGWK